MLGWYGAAEASGEKYWPEMALRRILHARKKIINQKQEPSGYSSLSYLLTPSRCCFGLLEGNIAAADQGSDLMTQSPVGRMPNVVEKAEVVFLSRVSVKYRK